jgi:hypothetical protein
MTRACERLPHGSELSCQSQIDCLPLQFQEFADRETVFRDPYFRHEIHETRVQMNIDGRNVCTYAIHIPLIRRQTAAINRAREITISSL